MSRIERQVRSTYVLSNEGLKVTKWNIRMSGILISDMLHNFGIVNDVFEMLMLMSLALQNNFNGFFFVA